MNQEVRQLVIEDMKKAARTDWSLLVSIAVVVVGMWVGPWWLTATLGTVMCGVLAFTALLLRATLSLMEEYMDQEERP